MIILVTGASGLIGSRLCQRLTLEGHQVAGLTHTKCDICDYDTVYRAIELYRPDTVFHFAAHLPSTPNPEFIKVNVLGTVNLLDACYRNQVKDFVYASSMSVYSAPPEYLPVDENHPVECADLYGKTKQIGELLCQCYENAMHVPIIRFSSVFGPGDNSRVAYHFMKSSLSGEPIRVDGDGSASSDFIYVDDAVEGALLAWKHGKSGEIYNIGSGKETTILELANLTAGLADPRVDVVLSGRGATRPFRFVADIGKARRELRYEPSLLEDRLKKYWKEAE